MPVILPSEQGGTPLSLAQAEAIFQAIFRAAVSVPITSNVLTIPGSGRYKVLPQTPPNGQITSIVLTGEAVEGTLIQLRPETAGHTITVVHGGNLHLANVQNQVLTSVRTTLWLRHYGGNVWAQEGTVTFTD